jgi:type I restriction enzyme S subunit
MGIPHVDADELRNMVFCVPTMEEQMAIAEYLDKKCDSIDKVIAAQEKRVEYLTELKNRIITDAVTKGINPDAAMKNSGIEWIGQIPRHWDTMRLKYWLSAPLMYGANEAPNSESLEEPRYIRITDIDNNGNLKDETFCSLTYDIAEPYLLKHGDILFARSGATVGKTYIHNSNSYACFAGYLIKAEIDKTKANPEFVYFFTKSGIFNSWKDSINIQATIQNIGADKYANLFITYPPKDEQSQIVNRIKAKIEPIDSAITKVAREIELLKEFKQSIITDAVTGKIKVYNL